MARTEAIEWLPLTPDDLQMKSEPKAPAAPAIYLYRQVDRDDTEGEEDIYYRIKILTEEGRKYADVQIPYIKEYESIRNLQARTIRPDGTIVDFNGTIYEKPLVKARGVKLQAKSFSLPNVDVGSIVEYRYRHVHTYGYVFDSHWWLSEELFTRHAKFSLKPSGFYLLRTSWPVGLPEGTQPPKEEHGIIRLETRDVAAFVVEEHMPPEDVLKVRVDFIYDSEAFKVQTVEKFWKDFGKKRFRDVEKFISARRAMEKAVAQIVDPADLPQVKVRKIYAHMQELRNLSFERAKSEQEAQREKLADIHDAEDILRRGYGDGLDITWLFLGLVRAAGIEADAVLVSTRDRYFFDEKLQNAGLLNSNIVVVKLPAGEVCLDPGTPYTPFGMLPWAETGVRGLRLNKEGGEWLVTPVPAHTESRIERKLALKLTTSGSLEGKATVTYTGLEASWRRMSERHEGEAERKEFLEQDIEDDIPTGIEAKLTNTPGWSGSDAPLIAEYDLRVPGWASMAGKRMLIPVGLFGGGEKHIFEHAARVHPLYFDFPYQHIDDVTIELPPGWQVSSLPEPRSADLKRVMYSTTAEDAKGSLRVRRDLSVNLMYVNVKRYDAMRNFFQTVRAGDEEQIVVAPGAPPSSAKQ